MLHTETLTPEDISVSRTAYEQGVEDLIDRSFLARVPVLIRSGLSADEAIRQARKDDDALLFRLYDAPQYEDRLDNSAAEARKLLQARVYVALSILGYAEGNKETEYVGNEGAKYVGTRETYSRA